MRITYTILEEYSHGHQKTSREIGNSSKYLFPTSQRDRAMTNNRSVSKTSGYNVMARLFSRGTQDHFLAAGSTCRSVLCSL